MADEVTTREQPGSAPDEPEAAQQAAQRRFPTVWATIAVVVGLLLGYAAGLLTPSLRTPGDTSPEAGFARDMSSHHEQAVEMAMIAHQRGTNPDVLLLSYDIATGQQGEIGYMRRWLEEWRLSPTGSQPKMAWMPDGARAVRDGLMPGMATNEEIEKLRRGTGRQVDVLFAQYMLRHHLGGIHMIDAVLARSERPEVVELATRMKNSQQKEIEILRDLLEDLHAEPL